MSSLKLLSIDMLPVTRWRKSTCTVTVSITSGKITVSPEAVEKCKLQNAKTLMLGTEESCIFLVADHPKGIKCNRIKSGGLVAQCQAYGPVLTSEIKLPDGKHTVQWEVNTTPAFITEKAPCYLIKTDVALMSWPKVAMQVTT